MIIGRKNQRWELMGWLLTIILIAGCAGQDLKPQPPLPPQQRVTTTTATSLPLLGYTIQVGAFAKLDNAVRLMKSLQRQNLNAYYIKHASGLFKVRFGDFPSRPAAQKRAMALQKRALIDAFYIVKPKDYAVAKHSRHGNGALRKSLTNTAKRFLGVPYKWGGESVKEGFDCSGLTMTVYRMNGLKLPRNSRQQYRAGRFVKKSALQAGDLVFFATKGGKRVNHVGIYLGKHRFIHAPRTGKTIRIASLDSKYFRKRYQGGRSYMAN